MAFSATVKQQALARAGGQCECRREHPGNTNVSHHGGRCRARLVGGNWEAHHRTSLNAGGSDTLSNCEALCLDCHRATGSYGRSG